MPRTVTRWLVLCAAAGLSFGELVGTAQAAGSASDRAAIVTALEKLMATGEPRHTSHDDGEWLQRAVVAAIHGGDTEIERLAVRAAAPIVARVTRPVASIESPPSLKIDATVVLKLPRMISYRADILASVDGSEFAPLWKLQSGQRADGKIHEGLPKHAFQPGYHAIRLKAHLAFGPPQQPLWTETRDLPHLAYALYDPDARDKADPSTFLTAPLRVSAQQLDATLPDLPFSVWLDSALAGTKRNDRKHEWRITYCAERTAEPDFAPRSGALCSMMHFQMSASIGSIWIRTGELRFGSGGAEWVLEPPRFEAVATENAATLRTLWELVPLVQSDPSTWPKPDVSIVPEDIEVHTTSTAAGAQTSATVTVRNTGRSPAYGVLVEIVAATSEADTTGTSRHFVLDLPAEGSARLKLNSTLAAGYGFVMAHARCWSDHTPHGVLNDGASHDSEMAFKAVNPSLAPKGYVEDIRAKCGCSGW